MVLQNAKRGLHSGERSLWCSQIAVVFMGRNSHLRGLSHTLNHEGPLHPTPTGQFAIEEC